MKDNKICWTCNGSYQLEDIRGMIVRCLTERSCNYLQHMHKNETCDCYTPQKKVAEGQDIIKIYKVSPMTICPRCHNSKITILDKDYPWDYICYECNIEFSEMVDHWLCMTFPDKEVPDER